MAEVNYHSLYTVSVLKKLGVGNRSNFDDRLISQKVQYISQLFGLTPYYSFNLYLRGPYCPDLTRILYDIEPKNIIMGLKFSSPDMGERFKKVKGFIKNKDSRKLELITTFHLLRFLLGMRETSAVTRLKELKNANDKEVKYVIEEVSKLPK